MKKRTITLLVAAAAAVTGLIAQPNANRQALSQEQKEQMQEIREKYAPKIKEIKDDIRLKQVEQKTLLASKEVDEKAVYATIDAIGELKTSLHQETTSLRNEMKEVCPNANKMMAYKHGNRGPKQGQAYRKGNGQGPNNNNMRKGQGQAQRGQGVGQGQDRPRMQQGQGMHNNNRPNKQKAYANGQGPRHQQGMQQGRQGQGMIFGANCKLTDEQKTALAEIRKKHFWDIQETQNELALLKAKNTTVEERQAAYAEVNALQTKLAKQRMAQKLELMEQLTEEQRMQMISKKNHRKHRGPRAAQGQRPRNGKNI